MVCTPWACGRRSGGPLHVSSCRARRRACLREHRSCALLLHVGDLLATCRGCAPRPPRTGRHLLLQGTKRAHPTPAKRRSHDTELDHHLLQAIPARRAGIVENPTNLANRASEKPQNSAGPVTASGRHPALCLYLSIGLARLHQRWPAPRVRGSRSCGRRRIVLSAPRRSPQRQSAAGSRPRRRCTRRHMQHKKSSRHSWHGVAGWL